MKSRDTGRSGERGQTGERDCHRDAGTTPVVEDKADLLWIYSGAVHLSLQESGD